MPEMGIVMEQNQTNFILDLADYLYSIRGELLNQITRVDGNGVDWNLDRDSATMSVTAFGKRSAVLTSKEFQIVNLLSAAPQKTMAKAKLLQVIWDGTSVSAKTVNVHIYNLRKKLLAIGVGVEFVEPGCFRLVKV